MGIPEAEIDNYKVHFATGSDNKMMPYEKLLLGTEYFKAWQEEQTKRNFSLPYILSLVYVKENVWVFGGVYKVLPTPPRPIKKEQTGWEGWKYETELTDLQKDLIGRIYVSYKRNFRASYPELKLKPKVGEALPDMLVHEIRAERASIRDFTGFDKIDLTYDMLSLIVKERIPSWEAALSGAKGVYLIVDTKTGKQYVGSAYGDDCFWQRWSEYAKNGHGGNAELKRVLQENGEEYKRFFKYSVLEICNMNIGNEYVIERETFWKEVLLTRKFGYNDN